MKIDINELVRKNIRQLKPYSSARQEFAGEAAVFLDANENAFGSAMPVNYHRYPDPLQRSLKASLARMKEIDQEHIFIGNGSDEIIDLAYRVFCIPGVDNLIVCPPTYGMYEVSAAIHDIEVRKVNLVTGFQLDVKGIMDACDANTKLLFICSPNNPTGNCMKKADIKKLLQQFKGIVVIDEAYIDYAAGESILRELTAHNNVVVMQTFSKAWGLAALRLGICYASVEIVDLFNKVKAPYNVNRCSQELGLEAMANESVVKERISACVVERESLRKNLAGFSFVEKVYPSDANFLLVEVQEVDRLYGHLKNRQVIVRNRSKEPGCDNCLRITIGTAEENELLLKALNSFV